MSNTGRFYVWYDTALPVVPLCYVSAREITLLALCGVSPFCQSLQDQDEVRNCQGRHQSDSDSRLPLKVGCGGIDQFASAADWSMPCKAEESQDEENAGPRLAVVSIQVSSPK